MNLCHYREKISLTFSDEQKRRKSIWNKKSCQHPLKSECDGKIVEAHTVPRSMLAKISTDSHVYSPDHRKTPTKFEIYMRRIGIGDASTFNGFCKLHDRETFSLIENQPFIGSAEQCFLYFFRAVSKELALKEAHVRDVELSQSKSDVTASQLEFLDDYLLGVEAGREELFLLKQKLDEMLNNQNFSGVRYCIFWLDAQPHILANSVFQLDFDFSGNLLQDSSDLSSDLAAISASFIIDSSGSGAIVMVWHEDANNVCLQFIQSILAWDQKDWPKLLTNWIVMEAENIFFAPKWWESLPLINRDIVMEVFMNNPSLMRMRTSDDLREPRIGSTPFNVIQYESNAFGKI